uniref:Uncharacterized protein n=1 Tax=Rhizophora mucronata TaxID=61149 RepID=A0A2P2QL24_RHIMU
MSTTKFLATAQPAKLVTSFWRLVQLKGVRSVLRCCLPCGRHGNQFLVH